jgi:hypothetical protein
MIDTATFDTWRFLANNRYGIPAEWEFVEVSAGCGRKIRIYSADGTVVLIRARTGRNSWDTCDSYLRGGRLQDPKRGPAKVAAAISNLAKAANAGGLAGALASIKEGGICCICGANLKDPESIQRGIGPECIKKVQARAIMAILFGQSE